MVRATRTQLLALVLLLAIAILSAAMLFLGSGTAQAAGAGSGLVARNGLADQPNVTMTHPPEFTRTPEPPHTPPPNVTEPPHATRTPEPPHTPGPTRTPPPNVTEPPHATRTPEPPHTPGPTRTLPPPNLTTTPRPVPTHQPPPPITLRPHLQFGHGQPGSTVDYRLALLNRAQAPLSVSLDGRSLNGWALLVDPLHVQTQPGHPQPVSVTVGIPVSPTHRLDIEQVSAQVDGTNTATSAYIVTIVTRHSFSDLPAGYWADDPIQYLVEEGALSGYADGSFRPNDNVTRAQFAKMMVSALGWSLVTPSTPTFSDVPTGYWAYGFIETAVAHGALSGYADGSFRPGADVTRAQAARMVANARAWSLDVTPAQSFTDVTSGDWFYSYVGMMTTAEAMNGYGDGTFRPNAPATRAQIAKILALSLFSDPNE